MAWMTISLVTSLGEGVCQPQTKRLTLKLLSIYPRHIGTSKTSLIHRLHLNLRSCGYLIFNLPIPRAPVTRVGAQDSAYSLRPLLRPVSDRGTLQYSTVPWENGSCFLLPDEL